MKKIAIFLSLSFFVVIGCQKENLKPQDSAQVSVNEDVSVLRNNFKLLTGNTWIYMKYYVNYVDTTNPGQLAYKRGRENNQIVLDNTSITFLTDGTVDEIDENGNHVPGVWSFLDPAQTIVSVTNAFGTFNSNILLLSRKKYYWFDDFNHTAGLMVAKTSGK